MKTEITKKAMKQYTCNNCCHVIQKGELYNFDSFYVKASYDSQFDTSYRGHVKIWRSHVKCPSPPICHPPTKK